MVMIEHYYRRLFLILLLTKCFCNVKSSSSYHLWTKDFSKSELNGCYEKVQESELTISNYTQVHEKFNDTDIKLMKDANEHWIIKDNDEILFKSR